MTLAHVPELLLQLDPDSTEPLHRQVYHGIREAILSGRLPGGVRIPSSRRLADYLDISRSTVLVAFEQLVAEGYLIGAVGSGSYVASQIPDHLLPTARPASAPAGRPSSRPAVAKRCSDLRAMRRRAPRYYPGAFWTGVPPVDAFPLSLWRRLATRRYRQVSASQLYHGPAAGYRPLREAIVTHLAGARGVHCTADQVIVLSSAQEAMELTCRVLLDPGDAAWIENPSWSGARGALTSGGARVAHVPVDRHGLIVDQGIAAAPDARLVYVCPSHQYPSGAILSLERRLQLLEFAASRDAWIIEDDYDSEYRYSGRPLTALQGLDSAGRVVYVGTFNKTLFPALRLAYVVVPQDLLAEFLAVRGIGGQHSPTIEQAILCDFITEGHYARHLRRSRTLCRERRAALVAAVARHLAGVLEIAEDESGLHAVAWLPAGLDDVRVSAAASQQGIEAAPLSAYYEGECPRGGLVLGYAGLKLHEIDAGVRKLALAIASLDQQLPTS
jgi:GntR family transcriptional regulator/MocR family aminotransferase